jgi:hypothetical protein
LAPQKMPQSAQIDITSMEASRQTTADQCLPVIMKPRHVVALAFVGWYLMVPPQSLVKLDLSGLSAKSPDIEVDRRVDEALQRADALPLSRWQMQGSYDTAKECKDQVDYDNENNSAIPNIAFAKCIATDDPRLKGN